MKNNKGYDEKTGDKVVVKVCGGYTIMTASQYNGWKKQK